MEETKDLTDTNLSSKELSKSENNESSKSVNNSKILENDPIVMHRHFFWLREHHDSDFISWLDFNEKYVFIGTTTGSLFKLDNVWTVIEMNTIHTTKVTSIIIENNDIVLSCSEKGDILIHSLMQEFSDIGIFNAVEYFLSNDILMK